MSKNPLKSIPEVPGRCPRAQRVQTQDHHRLGAGVGKGLPSPARGPRRGQRRGRGGQGYAGPPAAATRSPPARSSGTYMVSAIIAGGRDPYRRGGRNGRLRGPPTQKGIERRFGSWFGFQVLCSPRPPPAVRHPRTPLDGTSIPGFSVRDGTPASPNSDPSSGTGRSSPRRRRSDYGQIGSYRTSAIASHAGRWSTRRPRSR